MSEEEFDESLGEWDGDEFNGWRFIYYEDLHINQGIQEQEQEQAQEQAQEQEQSVINVVDLLRIQFSNCISCECGAETVRTEGTVSCFWCGQPLTDKSDDTINQENHDVIEKTGGDVKSE